MRSADTALPHEAAVPASTTLPRPTPGRRPLLWLTLAAIALRLVVFLGRGDYVAFDEGWYLLLGRNLVQGDGFTLTGLRHVALSPLFPVLAGALSLVIESPVWAGRVVAAFAAGLLVWPCWYIFDRLADRRTAWIACVFIAVMPALAPFAAPYWIRWDLWVGAEPLLHVFLYGGLAFALRGWQYQRQRDWAFAGGALALAYLARSEAILPLGILGLMLMGRVLWLRTPRAAVNVLTLALAFGVTAAPYWIYLHDALGRWTITGRGVQVVAPRTATDSETTAAPASPAAGIERMLWEEDQRSYMYSLYALDESATQLSSAYWGIRSARPAPAVPPPPIDEEPIVVDTAATRTAGSATTDDMPVNRPAPTPGRWSLYARALATGVPWFLWPFIALGLFGARRAWRQELVVAAPLVLTSIAIARIVAADPRTQLFIVPLAAFYTARGVCRLGLIVDRATGHGSLRRGFAATATAAILTLLLFGTVARWVYLGTSMGSPHHLVGSANRAMGEALRDIVPHDEPVMSWHPAIALYARRDWRVLPHASFDNVVRYAQATDTRYVVISQYYPPQGILGELPREHLVVVIPPDIEANDGQFQLELRDAGATHVFGTLRSSASTAEGVRDGIPAEGGS